MLIAGRPILIEEKVSNLCSRFTLESPKSGFDYTLGNSLCRTLLSSIPGVAVTSIHVGDVPHEFRMIGGVKEDAAEIILNIKQIALSGENDEFVIMYLRKAGPGEVPTGDITPPVGAEVCNPGLHLTTLNERGELEIELIVERGYGYVSVTQNKDPRVEIPRIPIDSIYSPVVKVIYKVEATRVR